MANLKIVKLIREGDDGNIGSYPYYKVVDDVAVANPNLYNVTVGVDHGYDFQGDATCDMLVWDSNNE